MSNLKSILKEHINEIIVDMIEELLNDRIIRFWNINDEDLTLRQFVDKYWEDKSEFAVDLGLDPFRFIHWNIQAVPKEMAKDV